MGVAVGRLHLEDALAELEDGDVEGAAAQVVHGDDLVLLLVETVCERGRGGLVDDTEHLEAGDLARVLGRLALTVVEIGGDGDHRLGHLFAQVGLRGLLELAQDHRRDLGRRILLAPDLDADIPVGSLHHLVGDELHFLLHFLVAPPHEALDREDGVFGVGDGLTLGDLAHQHLAFLRKRDHRRREAAAFLIGDDERASSFHDCNDRVGGAEVDADHLRHADLLLQATRSRAGACENVRRVGLMS